MEGKTPVSKYVWLLIGTNLAFVALFSLVSFWLGLDPGSTPSLVLFVVSIAVPSYAFVKDHGREPSKAERKRLVRWSFVGYLLFSAVLLALLLALPGPLVPMESSVEPEVQTVVLIMGIALAIGMLLVYGALVAGYRLFTKKVARGFEQQARQQEARPSSDESG